MALVGNRADDCLLSGRALHAWYGSSHVLHGVDIDIGEGETLGLLGRNGMGKSTLIRTLLGHVARRDGSIRVRGATARGPGHTRWRAAAWPTCPRGAACSAT
jgi:ABC-type branched-subunit amino acid transport system ATPase component